MSIVAGSLQLGGGTTAEITAAAAVVPLVRQVIVNRQTGQYYIGDGTTALGSLTAYGGASGLTVGTTTITSGTNTRILYNNAGVVGEYLVTGTGTTAVLSTSPTFTTSITTPLVNNIYPKRGNNIYTIGDSLTAADVYQIQLISLLGSQWNTVNLGVGGNTTTQMVARIKELTNAEGDYCIIWAGINDIIGAVADTTIIANIQAMATQAKNAGFTTVVLTTTPFKNNAGWAPVIQLIQDSVNTAILTTITDIDYAIDVYPLLEGATNELNAAYDSGDGLHLNTAGYNLVGSTINSSLTFTLNSTSVEVRPTTNLILDQTLNTISTPSFKGLNLTGNLTIGSNTITSGSITSSGTGAFASVTASGNSTFTGIVYSLNSFQLGASGVNGVWTVGGSSMKLVPGSGNPSLILCTNTATNGRLKLINTTGNILIGDIASISDNTTDQLQVYGSSNTQVLNLSHSAPAINMKPSGATNAVINFRNNLDTLTKGFIDLNLGSGEMKFWGGSGGYFVTIGANGSERMRVTTTGNVLINTAAVATTATDGFLYISSCAGTPTGVPTANTGRNAVVWDSTNKKLYVYDGGWNAMN